jgi:lipoate---protein ligase
MKWTFLDTGRSSAASNMSIDADLLKKLKAEDPPLLRLYDWQENSATYGYFIDPFKYIEEKSVDKYQLDLAKRPTGGGIVFHLCDLSFSLLMPASHPKFSFNTLENYAFVNAVVLEALQLFFGKEKKVELLAQEHQVEACECHQFCFSKPVQFDLVIKNKKIAGGAQRRTRNGYLHQGSIAIALPDEDFFKSVLKTNSPVFQGMKQESCALLDQSPSLQQVLKAKLELKELLKTVFQSV